MASASPEKRKKQFKHRNVCLRKLSRNNCVTNILTFTELFAFVEIGRI